MIRWLAALLVMAQPAFADPPPKPAGAVRVASFNAALSRRDAGALAQELRLGGSAQIDAVAEIVQRVRPDILLVNEIDFDRRHVALRLFRDALREGRGGAEGVDYPHLFAAPVNTGLLSGHDLDGDGRVTRPGDAFGHGWFEGQYGMAILSRLPLSDARTFQRLRWVEMPGALIPLAHYGAAAEALRLSSKSHWDLAATLPDGRVMRLLASHPTPPVFDGPEDANGRRNHDEIRFWVDYVDGEGWMTDDAGRPGGLPQADGWVILGDLNADPEDGDGRRGAIRRLLEIAQDPRPASEGGAAATEPGRRGDPRLATAFWPDGPGALRVDYVLPSQDWEVAGAGVFWPPPGDPLRRLVGEGDALVSSDHRLVWVDLR